MEQSKSKGMTIKSLVIEHRPRLQSANFFIQFNSGLDPQERIQVKLTNQSITITQGHGEKRQENGNGSSETVSSLVGVDDHLEISTKDCLEVLTNSLSALVARDSYLSFRVNTNTRNFNEELLRAVGGVDRFGGFVKVEPNIGTNIQYILSCANCTRELGNANWGRICELPSGNFDSGDWFCHKTIDFNVAAPKKKEIFYGYYFTVVNSEVFVKDHLIIKEATNLVYCKRCLQFLGERSGDSGDDGIKIWNENLFYTTQGDDKEQKQLLLKGDLLLKNFQNLIRKIVHDFEFVDRFTCLLPTMHKVLVKSIRTDSSKEVKSVYLLIQVMELRLDMLEWVVQEKGLRKRVAMKLMFCVGGNTEQEQLVKYWENDQNVHSLVVSPRMFDVVLERLRDNAETIPGVYRHSYGFELSYLFED